MNIWCIKRGAIINQWALGQTFTGTSFRNSLVQQMFFFVQIEKLQQCKEAKPYIHGD